MPLGTTLQGVRQLGVEMKPRTNRGKERFAPNQGKEHFLKLAGEPNEGIDISVCVSRFKTSTGSEHLNELPQDDEIWSTMRGMKPSAAGDDEITIDILRCCWENIRVLLCELVRKMWMEGTTGSQWEETTTRAVVTPARQEEG